MEVNRLELAKKCLKGISIGDAFGDSFFGNEEEIKTKLAKRELPETKFEFTDDTVMAISLYKSLEKYGCIDQDFVSNSFTENYFLDTYRGYGPSMHRYFREIEEGLPWQKVAKSKFNGMGSMGNGGAMRAGVIGAYFYDDLEKVLVQSELSSVITHTHIEAIEGTKAIAIGTALATQIGLGIIELNVQDFLTQVYDVLSDSDLKSKVKKAIVMEGEFSIETLVYALGNGTKMTAQDTVPIALWLASRYLNDFESCMWKSVSALGDRDTICAMSGGITVMSASEESVPAIWKDNVENWEKSEFYGK
ncbi:MAG: ADP-ribosylglycohydrolase family protein [Limnohabitans sp.]|nr:ADP-ribosylglycohydrolase family protein [Limnohabitans sp.]